VRADAQARARLPVFPEGAPGLLALMRRVKHSFDPMGVFNPGRMYKDF